MTSTHLLSLLVQADFSRVERDDRLLDVFTDQTREKGVELWEKWHRDLVYLVFIKLPYQENNVALYEIYQSQVSHLLTHNLTASLTDFSCIATSSKVQEELKKIS